MNKYILLKDRLGHKAGIEVYDYCGCTYGLISDDDHVFGVEHKAVTLDQNGGIPFFTVPKTDIRKV